MGWGGGLWCPPLLAILPHHRAELRSCAHIARRLVLALENTRSRWVMLPSAWATVWRPAALAHCWRAWRPWALVWARLSSREARCPPMTLGLLSSRAARRSASPMKAAKRVEGMILTMGLRWRGVVEVCPPRLNLSYSIGSPCRGSSAQIGTVPQLAHGLGWGAVPC
jgi:hypothetical protein